MTECTELQQCVPGIPTQKRKIVVCNKICTAKTVCLVGKPMLRLYFTGILTTKLNIRGNKLGVHEDSLRHRCKFRHR